MSQKRNSSVNVLLVFGPNLNLLGEREPDLYGSMSYKKIVNQMKALAHKNKIKLKVFQSNHEGELIDFLHSNRSWASWLLFNPAGLTHTSICLRDAVLACNYQLVEFHFTNYKKREKFRRVSLFSDIAQKTYAGENVQSLLKAFEYIIKTRAEANPQQDKRRK